MLAAEHKQNVVQHFHRFQDAFLVSSGHKSGCKRINSWFLRIRHLILVRLNKQVHLLRHNSNHSRNQVLDNLVTHLWNFTDFEQQQLPLSLSNQPVRILPNAFDSIRRFATLLQVVEVLHREPEQFERGVRKFDILIFGLFLFLIFVFGFFWTAQDHFRELVHHFVEEFPLQLNIQEVDQGSRWHALLQLLNILGSELVTLAYLGLTHVERINFVGRLKLGELV